MFVEIEPNIWHEIDEDSNILQVVVTRTGQTPQEVLAEAVLFDAP